MPLKVDVLVFDSGVGGLSILEAIRNQKPELSYAFVGDNAGLPYGDKAEAWLLERVPRVIEKALLSIECRLLVVACNTASTVVLPTLRSQFRFPVIGVVPAIKPAALISRKKIIGLLATPATIQRRYTDTLITEFAADCQVIKVGSSRLVTIAEEKLRGIRPDRQELTSILEPFVMAGPDVVVLGCTHFPLLQHEFTALLPTIVWVDSGQAIAQRVGHFALESTPLSNSADGQAYFTARDISLEPLHAFGLRQLHFLEI